MSTLRSPIDHLQRTTPEPKHTGPTCVGAGCPKPAVTDMCDFHQTMYDRYQPKRRRYGL